MRKPTYSSAAPIDDPVIKATLRCAIIRINGILGGHLIERYLKTGLLRPFQT